jgi:cell division protein FtsB
VTPAKRWLLSYFAAVAALLAISASHPQGLSRYQHLDENARRVAGENKALGEEVGRLRHEVRALSGEPAALERAAREELGYVRPGEIVFQLDEPRGRP